MNFSQLDLIRAIQEKRSITAAAEAVGFTQSAASRALSSLEDELGVILVNRSRNGGVLTEVGNALLPHIYEILAHTEYIRQEAAARRGLSVGKLRIGSVQSMPARLLSQLVGTFRQRYPGIGTVVFEGNEAEVITWLQQGIVDVGLVTYIAEAGKVIPMARDEYQSITTIAEDSKVIPIVRDEYQLVVSEQHRLGNRNTVQASELVHEAFVLPKFRCETLIRTLFQDAHISLNLQPELSDMNTVLAMVKEGLGITILPHMNLPETLANLRVLSFEPPQYRYVCAAVSNIKSASPASRALIELACDFDGCSIQGSEPVLLNLPVVDS